MQLETYQYLFPFEKIRQGAKILIYGAGILGQEYWKQIQITKYCRIVAFIDKNADKIAPFGIPLYKPDDIAKLSFDYVVVALRNDHFLRDVKRILYNYGVRDEAIVCVCQRNTSMVQVRSTSEQMETYDFNRLAYINSSRLPIALHMVGGIGDAIIKKCLVEAIVRLMPDCVIDIYSSHNLSWLYSDFQRMNELVPDNGVLYRRQCDNYSLALTIKSYYIEIDHFSENQIQKLNESFARNMKRLQTLADVSMFPKYIVFMRHLYKGFNCYTGFSYGGIFDIKDSKVHIPLLKEFEERYCALGLRRYITVNFGNGDSEDMRLVAKAWPRSRFDKVITMFKEKYPAIQVVQLGTKSAEKIQGADRYFFGESFELVKHILKQSIFHLDIEGGLVHLASQLGTKCVVLFGPTSEKYVGYPQNINIKAGNCHDCYGLYNDLGRCARDMAEPECMYSITPEMVMEKVEEYMENTVKKDYVKYRIYIEGLVLEKPLIVGLRDNADIITDVEIAQDTKNNGAFEIKCYLNPAAGIQAADDVRIRAAFENVIGNLSLCTKAHIGVPEYIESNISEKKSCMVDIVFHMDIVSNENVLETIKNQLCQNHQLNSWEMLYRMAMLSKDVVTRFMLLYAILSSSLETTKGGRRILQAEVDSFIRKKCIENEKTEYLGHDEEKSTIYTLLRNAIGHAKVETNLSEAYNQITNKVTELAEITLWAIREIDNG